MHPARYPEYIWCIYTCIATYLVAIVSNKYVQNPAKVFANRKAIDSRTALGLYSYILQNYNVAIRI